MQLKHGEFSTLVSIRLGVDVMEGGQPCGFCGLILDSKGLHCWSCMAGGDATAVHNGIRDIFYDYCDRAALRPSSEAPGVLADILGRQDRRRPADVLCLSALTLARRLPDGSRAVRIEPVCFDFAVINALGQGHRSEMAAGSGSAAEAYDQQKRTHLQTERLCAEAGYRFWPVVFETQGGISKAATEAIQAISEALAEREHREPALVRREFKARIAVLMARSAVRSIRKRERPRTGIRTPWMDAVESTLRQTQEDLAVDL